MSESYQLIIFFYAYLPAVLIGLCFWGLCHFERRLTLWVFLAFFWGAFGAGIMSEFWNSFFHVTLPLYERGNSAHEALNGIVIAPFVEELTKGFVLILVLIWGRLRQVSDGILLGLLIGLGFAASENVFYANEVFAHSGELAMWNNLWFRVLHTTFLHASATAVWGLWLGRAFSSRGVKRFFVVMNGFILAVVMHGFWNFLADYASYFSDNIQWIATIMRFEIIAAFGVILILFMSTVAQEKNQDATDSAQKNQSYKMALFGVLVFVSVIGVMLFVYQSVIVVRVKNSIEFQVAEFYARHSRSVAEKLPASLETIAFRGVHVDVFENYGVCKVDFDLSLQDKSEHRLEVGLVKVADFWIVYSSNLDSGGMTDSVVSNTYRKVLLFLEHLDDQDLKKAVNDFELIRLELANPDLVDYLAAKLAVAQGETGQALKLLEKIRERLFFSQLAVWHDEALVYFNRQDYKKSAEVLLHIEDLFQQQSQKNKTESVANIFQNLPKDPLQAILEPKNVLASARKLLSLVYNFTGDYQKGLLWAEQAIAQAEQIQSSVLRVSSVYLKALNLYSLGRFDEAEKQFTDVISDLDSPNLLQKSWAYYFKADIAARANRPIDSLDYYELAVTLEPTNAFVRKAAIEYLMARSFVGDNEIALGMALRGMDYEIQKESFKKLASQIYVKLGLPDRTFEME